MSAPTISVPTAPPKSWLRLAADLIRYAAASAVALLADYGALLALTKFAGVDYLIAAAAGFSVGLAVVYLLSVGYVFSGRRMLPPRAEFLGFLATGLLGLVVNEALMGVFVGGFGVTVALAKIPTAGCVFLLNFTTRRALLFARGTRER